MGSDHWPHHDKAPVTVTSWPPPPRKAWLLLAGALGLEIPVIYQGARSSFQTELKGKKSCWKKFIPVSCKPLAPQAVQDDSWGSRLALGWHHVPQHAQGYGTCHPPQPCSQRQNICMEHWRRTALGKQLFLHHKSSLPSLSWQRYWTLIPPLAGWCWDEAASKAERDWYPNTQP